MPGMWSQNLGWDPYRNFNTGVSSFAEEARRRAAENSKKNKVAEAKALLPPDLTDQIIRQVQRGELLKQQTGRTRQSTFGFASLFGG